MGTASVTQRRAHIEKQEKCFDARHPLRQHSMGLTKARHLSALSGISAKYKKEQKIAMQKQKERKLYELRTRGSSLFGSKQVIREEDEMYENGDFECFHRASKLREEGYNQYCNKVIMIEPTAFYTNEGCIVDNGFMKRVPLKEDLVQKRVGALNSQANEEWKNYKAKLEEHGIEVVPFKQERDDAPDSVWPDWFTTLKCPQIPDGVYILYPMKSKERSKERQQPVMDYLASKFKHCIDLTHFEDDGLALEGKACKCGRHGRSPRCNSEVVTALIEKLNEISSEPKWKAVVFKSFDKNGNCIYHTDCMLTLYSHHAVICLDSIRDRRQRQTVVDELVSSGLNSYGAPYEIINISLEEINHMVCNGFNLRDKDGYSIITMSARAYAAIDKDKLAELKRYYTLVVPDIQVLEDVGGGSTRCLLAEHF